MSSEATTYNLVERLRNTAMELENKYHAELLAEAAWRIETLESYLEGAEPTEHLKP